MIVRPGIGIPRPVPKPKDKKKKNMYNGYKNKHNRVCYYCGTPNAERHEIYGGPNRQISIQMGFQVDLCPNCHLAWHEQSDDLWIERKKEWQAKAQKKYEEKLISDGMSQEATRRHWMALIGKNYR